MTLVTRSASASMDTSTGMFAPQITGNLYAGEALDVVAACYIKASDGKVYMSNGTASNEAAKFDGFTARACAIGEPVTLFGIGARFRYGTSLTVGASYYIGATAGRLDTAATTGGLTPIARVLHGGTDIRVVRNFEGSGDGVPTAASLTGLAAAVVADVNVVGGLTVLHRIDLAAGALADTDVVLTHKTRVIDAWLVLRGAGVSTTTLTVKNTATAITNAMAASGSDTALVRAATLDDAAWEIAAGGTLRVTSATGASQPAATVFVLGIRVA